MIPVAFVFAKDQICNSRISDFVGVPVSEKSAKPLYFMWRRVKHRGQEWDALFYSLFWVVNPGYVICGKQMGYHPADVETLVILHDKMKMPKWVYFGAHSKGQGVWQEWSKCDFTEDGKLKVYVSPQSHGFYPKAKTYWRICCLANDVCSGNDSMWSPRMNDFEDSANQTWSKTHFQVKRGINTPLNASDPPEQSITCLGRMCLCMLFFSKQHKCASHPQCPGCFSW